MGIFKRIQEELQYRDTTGDHERFSIHIFVADDVIIDRVDMHSAIVLAIPPERFVGGVKDLLAPTVHNADFKIIKQ